MGIFFDTIQGVWKFDKPRSLVFDISFRSKLKLRRMLRNKILKIYSGLDQLSKHRHGYDIPSINLMNY